MKKNILIIDDDPTIRHLLGRLLEKEGYHTLEAANGQEGFGVVQTQAVHLIILDILMPIMDGFTFFKELKINSMTHHIPVLVLTVRKQMEDSFMALGADAFMGKPFNSEKLLSEIKMILNHGAAPAEPNPALLQKTGGDYVMPPPVSSLQPVKTQGQSIPKHVLIAGSMDEVVNFMAGNFKQLGCSVTIASSGEEVVQKALELEPEIILLEINMDAMSVHDITEALKQNPHFRPHILLYSVFMTRETEKNSILKTLYRKDLNNAHSVEPAGDAPQESLEGNPLIHYLGAFHKESFISKISRLFPLYFK